MPTDVEGRDTGFLHEGKDQGAAMDALVAWSRTAPHPDDAVAGDPRRVRALRLRPPPPGPRPDPARRARRPTDLTVRRRRQAARNGARPT